MTTWGSSVAADPIAGTALTGPQVINAMLKKLLTYRYPFAGTLTAMFACTLTTDVLALLRSE
jgi:hypothetical protein